MKILISGFEPFNGEDINPSWLLVQEIPDKLEDKIIHKVCIPTCFYESMEVLLFSINKYKPDYVLCVGQAGGRCGISIERIGINIDDARIPDNNNNQPIDKLIHQDGDDAYFVNLPIKRMKQSVEKIGIPCVVSNTAGTFVCNHVLYSLLYHIKHNHICKAGGFIHVPYTPSQVLSKSCTPSMNLDDMVLSLIEIVHSIDKEEILLSDGSEI